MADDQISWRLDPGELELLDTVAYLAGKKKTDVAREAVRAYLADKSREPRVVAALRLRAEEAGQPDQGVPSITKRRARKSAQSDGA